MKKMTIVAAIAAAAIGSTGAHAIGGMEKCKVVDENGKGLIKAKKADCAGAGHSCAGQNKAGDPESWILVPKGACAKINKGDLSNIPKHIKDKIEHR